MGITFRETPTGERFSLHRAPSSHETRRWAHLGDRLAREARMKEMAVGESWVVVDPRALYDPDPIRAEQLVVVTVVDDIGYVPTDRVAVLVDVFEAVPPEGCGAQPQRLVTDGQRNWLVGGRDVVGRPKQVRRLAQRLFDEERLQAARALVDRRAQHRDEAPVWLGALEASTQRALAEFCGDDTARFDHVVDLDAVGFTAETTVSLPLASLQKLLHRAMQAAGERGGH